MRTIRFKSCKAASRIPLEKLALFFRMQKSTIWREYMVLHGQTLENILKKHCDTKYVYLFEFGSVTFVDFDDNDVQIFFEFLDGLVDKIKYSMMARFTENHYIEILENGEFRPWNGNIPIYKFDASVISIISVILAKSVALDKIEAEVTKSLDKSEKYIQYLGKGQLHINKKALSAVAAGFLKFEYESINNIRIFDRSMDVNNNIASKEIYDLFSDYYELNDRFEVLQRKINSLRNTMKTYNSLSYQKNEIRLYLLEVFLLAVFPLVSVIRLFFHH